ncbi:uncharacterized protein LOC101893436 [Musca domestica]|uniref:Uncharacterized protein LOC101893436 n=1 Tax=Musca domestica TaxID=7370 RepID=A0A1I8M7S8_MUSDO|nr:uncharacterized protein LOC101893436 [Musca domestica]
MAGLIDKRKRSREDDVSCDSTPLSKRINNLHLSNFEEAAHDNLHNNNNNHLQQHMSKEAMHMHHATASVSKPPPMNTPNGETNNAIYHPELNKSENPFYYDKNKLLHELHLERLKRCTV